MVSKSNKTNSLVAGLLVIGLSLFLFFSLLDFLNAFFVAVILFVLFKPLYLKFANKLSKGLSAFLIILITFLIVLIPLTFVSSQVVSGAVSLYSQKDTYVQKLDDIDNHFDKINLSELFNKVSVLILRFIKSLVVDILHNISDFLVKLIIMYMILYTLLVNSEKLGKIKYKYIPFSDKNAKKLLVEFKNVTSSVILATGLIALMQAILLTAALLIFGVDSAFLLGFIGFILAFIPFVGVPFVWVPVTIIFLLQQNYVAGIGMLILGIFMSSMDDVVRPILQKKVGEINPLVSILGIALGIKVFGIIGLFIGPIIISLFLLLSKMYAEEYIQH